jgi:hypothetical protein
LLKQQPDGGGTIHAITTPGIKPLQQIRREAYMGWMGQSHGLWLNACLV